MEPMMPLWEFFECAVYDACMEGPRFNHWDRSALDRLRKKYEQAIHEDKHENKSEGLGN